MRKKLVYAMRTGDTFVIDFDNSTPEFKQEWTSPDEPMFPLEEICDFDKWREDNFYMKVVREDENFDLTKQSRFEMRTEHQIAFLAKYTSDEDMVKVVKNIPESDMMQVLIIEPQRTVEEQEQLKNEEMGEPTCTCCVSGAHDENPDEEIKHNS